MTSDEAMRYVNRRDLDVSRNPDASADERWWVADKTGSLWYSARGPTLAKAVTRLKAKLEAGR